MLLLDPVNFAKYREYRNLVADLRGYSTQTKVTVSVLRPGKAETLETDAEVLVTGG